VIFIILFFVLLFSGLCTVILVAGIIHIYVKGGSEALGDAATAQTGHQDGNGGGFLL
jgi:hypothetical protein